MQLHPIDGQMAVNLVPLNSPKKTQTMWYREGIAISGGLRVYASRQETRSRMDGLQVHRLRGVGERNLEKHANAVLGKAWKEMEDGSWKS